jgi:thymidylate kinase
MTEFDPRIEGSLSEHDREMMKVGGGPEQISSREKEKEKTLIVSLLGPTASGKSTAANILEQTLAGDGISSVVIKKDDAITRLAVEKHGEGKEWRGYTSGQKGVEQELNRQILEQVGKVKVILLEGGTRTRKSASVTLRGSEDLAKTVIVKFEISPFEVRDRLRNRKETIKRIDDSFPLAAGKLISQYIRPMITKSPQAGDVDVEVLNANNSTEQIAADLKEIILKHLKDL